MHRVQRMEKYARERILQRISVAGLLCIFWCLIAGCFDFSMGELDGDLHDKSETDECLRAVRNPSRAARSYANMAPSSAHAGTCMADDIDGRLVWGDGPPLVRLDPLCGRLSYGKYAARERTSPAQLLPDFSYAGYRGGGVLLPETPVFMKLTPVEGDNRAQIQEAIDRVSALPVNPRGFRGAIYLGAGIYPVHGGLHIRTSGVVLRGEGQGPDGTRLVATYKSNEPLIHVESPEDAFQVITETKQRITSPLVPVGTRSFSVSSAAHFRVGDKVAIHMTPNHAWVDEKGMTTWGWDNEQYEILHERTIIAIDQRRISVDVPLVDSIELARGGANLVAIDGRRRVQEVGIEDLRLISSYRSLEDEDHAWDAIVFDGVLNSWVRRVTTKYFANAAVRITGHSAFNTVEEVAALDGISRLEGGRRYSFFVEQGLGNLFQRCFARNGRHNFVTGSRVTGPNVWLDSLAVVNHADEGPHHRWATGMLLDNIRSSKIHVQNRGGSGSGHGWAGAQVLFWNVEASESIRNDAPPGSMNWAIGAIGPCEHSAYSPTEPFGWFESWGEHVMPRSLYLTQLRDRLGNTAVDAVTTVAQRSGRIWELLMAWSGEGRLAGFETDMGGGCIGILEQNICCPLSCGRCGGERCAERPGGESQCCTQTIQSSAPTCDVSFAPCVLSH